MRVLETELPGVRIVEPRAFGDARGALVEAWDADRHRAAGLLTHCVLDLVSVSSQGVVRGLHYQQPFAQPKLVSVFEGEVFDVAVDIRPDAPTFGQWTGVTLSADNHWQLFIPPGFAHGFAVLSPRAVVHYKLGLAYRPEAEGGVAWDDPDLAIRWPVAAPVVSDRDRRHPRLRDVPRDRLPRVGETDHGGR